ncbi:MAG: 50S ribosomal protein L18 [Alphaproteobacteria bacterium]|nr:MAG: 50S ribosomal protein L18 [Alphaproteobacteria bacterium]
MSQETRSHRRKRRVSYRVFLTTDKEYVISVRKTSKYMYAQFDSVKERKTLTALSSRAVEKKKYNKEIAKKFGTEFGELIKKKYKADVSVAFNRGGMAYHGCVKEFADSVRSVGLKF